MLLENLTVPTSIFLQAEVSFIIKAPPPRKVQAAFYKTQQIKVKKKGRFLWKYTDQIDNKEIASERERKKRINPCLCYLEKSVYPINLL